MWLRASAVAIVLAALASAPLAAALGAGLTAETLWASVAAGAARSVEGVGIVVVPQALCAVAIAGLLVERLAARVAGWPGSGAPAWLDPAIESALLLGMLGTISGMLHGFSDLEPASHEPALLIRALGSALRSSFVGFSIALLGVWMKSAGSRLAEPGA